MGFSYFLSSHSLARKTAEVEDYETQLPEIKSRLAAAESLQPELDQLREEKALLISEKQDVAREVRLTLFVATSLKHVSYHEDE